jgi:hypothetical protein
MSESSDDVTIRPLPATLTELMTSIHELIEESNPRVILIDRDQGTLLVVSRQAAYTPEFNEMSLSFLLGQFVIDYAQDESAEQSARETLLRRVTERGLTLVKFCANPADTHTIQDVDGEVLWTDIVSQGNLLAACRTKGGEWSLLGESTLRSMTSV